MTNNITRKLSFDSLVINITRRCNMVPPCDHCMRGLPQNLDIDHNHIDHLLNQTELIEDLMLCGGEIFLNLPTMKYIICELRRRNIPLYRLSVTTNGLISASVIEPVFLMYHNYITECRANPYNRFRPNNPEEPTILLEVSYDRYHHVNSYPKIMSEYKAALSHLARVTINPNGLEPARLGNATTHLQEEDTVYHIPAMKKQIAILDSTHKPLCPIYKTWHLKHQQQIIVCCPLLLSCKGNILPRNSDESYNMIDDPRNIICTATDDIYDAIINYNLGKPDCIESYLIYYNQDFSKLRESKQNLFKSHSDDVILFENIKKFLKMHQTSDIWCNEVESTALNDSSMPYDDRKRILNNLRKKTQQYDYTQPPEPIPKNIPSEKWDNREASKWRRIYAEWIDEGKAENILTILKNKGLA